MKLLSKIVSKCSPSLQSDKINNSSGYNHYEAQNTSPGPIFWKLKHEFNNSSHYLLCKN